MDIPPLAICLTVLVLCQILCSSAMQCSSLVVFDDGGEAASRQVRCMPNGVCFVIMTAVTVFNRFENTHAGPGVSWRFQFNIYMPTMGPNFQTRFDQYSLEFYTIPCLRYSDLIISTLIYEDIPVLSSPMQF